LTIIIIIAVTAVAVHLGGGIRTHRRHRRAGLNPRLHYSLGRGWNGSVRLPAGFRVSPAPVLSSLDDAGCPWP
jgi:hypothetical protein